MNQPKLPLSAIFEAMYAQRFTGKVTFHFRHGYPFVLDQYFDGRRVRFFVEPPTP